MVTGRGGLPTNPNESLRGDGVLSAEWVELPQEESLERNRLNIERKREENQVSLDSVEVNRTKPLSDIANTRKIVEARGWIIGANGNVILTAESIPTTNVDIPWWIPHSCTR